MNVRAAIPLLIQEGAKREPDRAKPQLNRCAIKKKMRSIIN